MRNILLLQICLLVFNANAQKIFFPKQNYKDSTTLVHTMPLLADKIMLQYSEAEKTVYYDNMFRVALVAQKYNISLAYLDSLRYMLQSGDSSGIKGLGFQWETFAKTKLQHPADLNSFNILFTRIFRNNYYNLSSEAKTTAASYAGTKVDALKINFEKLLLDCSIGDTISLEDARALVRAYNSYHTYLQILPLMKPVLEAEDAREFIIKKVLIKTGDGSIVQALVVRKKELLGKLPSVFIFNIYIDSTNDLSKAKRYALAGYAGIVASTRGKGSSPQEIEPFEHDASDAYDVINWISRQPWSNKKVGMTGGSYLGFSQWAAAKTMHPALKTIMPEVAVGIGIDYPMYGNIFISYMLQWIHYVTNNKQTDYTDFNNSEYWNFLFKKWYREGASFRSLDTLEGRPNAIFQRWLKHPSFDQYWQNMAASSDDFSKITIPVLTTTGYFDDDQRGAMYYYRQHYLHKPNANHYLVIGPYNHGGAQSYPSKEVNGYQVDSVATTFNFNDLSIQWFNYILKDSMKPPLLKDKVNYEVMGANEWKHASSLEKMNNDTLNFYLGSTRIDEDYKLESTSAGNEFIKQEVDFKTRNDTTDSHEYLNVDSILLIRNALTFISKPFEKPVIINGSFTGMLRAGINKKDMDVRINMYEQMPDGKYFTLGYTYIRASYAKDRSKRQLLNAGMKEDIPVTDAFATCKQLSVGSRLIIVVGIIKTNDQQINYGTGKDVSDETIADANEPLQIKWYGDSFIKVPVWK